MDLSTLAAERAATQWIKQKLRDHKQSFWLLSEAIIAGAVISDPLPKGTPAIIRERLIRLSQNSLFMNLTDTEKLPTIQKISQRERKSE